MLKLFAAILALTGALLLPISAFADCCSYGCCDCSCISMTIEQTKAKADKVTADLNGVLHKHKIGGYVSEYRITMSKNPDGNIKPLMVPKECSYPCKEESATLLCKADCK